MDVEQLKKLMEEYPDLKRYLIDIFLVIKGVRKIADILTYPLKKQKIKILLEVVTQTNLVYFKETKYSYIVSTPEMLAQFLEDKQEDISKKTEKYLGHFCWNNNKRDNRSSLIAYIIIQYQQENIQIHIESCDKDTVDMKEFESHIINLSTAIQNALGHTFNVGYKIIENFTSHALYTEMKNGNIDFILKHLDDYQNEIANSWTDLPNNLSRNFEYLVRNNLDIVQHIWEQFIYSDEFLKTFEPIYKEHTNKRAQEFDKLIFSDENITIESIDRRWNEFLKNYLKDIRELISYTKSINIIDKAEKSD